MTKAPMTKAPMTKAPMTKAPMTKAPMDKPTSNITDKPTPKKGKLYAIYRKFPEKDWELWRILPPGQAEMEYRRAKRHKRKFEVKLTTEV